MKPLLAMGVMALSAGTMLNALNSSMIAVALVAFVIDLDSSPSDVVWLVSAFYVTSAAAQPVLGRMADRLGPRRVFVGGMIIVAIAGVFGPLMTDLTWLVAWRIILAVGASSAFPSATAIIRRAASSDVLSGQRALAQIATANIAGAAIGPLLGGLLTWLTGWQGIFWVNVPLALFAGCAVLMTASADPILPARSFRRILGDLDLPGIVLFSGAVCFVLLAATSQSGWFGALSLLIVGVLFSAGFWARERSAKVPFVNLVMLRRTPALLGVYGQFFMFNMVFYAVLFGLPPWLEQTYGLSNLLVGMVMLPLAAVGSVTSALLASYGGKRGFRGFALAGVISATAGVAGLVFASSGTPIMFVALACMLVGIGYAATNAELQARMYEVTATEFIGVAAGLYQSARSLGGAAAVTIVGVFYDAGVTTTALQIIYLAAACVGTVLIVINACLWRRREAKS